MRITDFAPAAVWSHFQTLCNIPRPSKHEERLRDHIQAWATGLGLATQLDKVGNLIIRKPATPGMEDRPGVVLQGHLDMVCQQNAGTGHDFHRDPITAVIRDGWLIAENTTLGADNGIGVSLSLAVLEATDLAHPALEVLLTIDEEAGMGGALGLEEGVLQGSLLINIDTEEWGEFYLGCAGGTDVNVSLALAMEPVPAGHAVSQLAIRGLTGGHSGVDIHLERGNAIKLMIRLLQELREVGAVRLANFEGGTARNALAREAFATITYPAALADAVAARIAAYQAELRFELASVDDGVTVELAPATATTVLALADHTRLLGALHAAPHGVRRMSRRVPGVVETSNNLGVIRIAEGEFSANFMVRSLLDAGSRALAAEIISLFRLIGADAHTEGTYPGWAPNPDSRLLALFQEVYGREVGGQAQVKVIHAGLECGIIGAKYPQMDMVSFGPDIRGAHAPGERVSIESVEKTWKLLTAVLAAIPPQR